MKSVKPGSLEEDWFFQALLECYLPLLQVLEAAALDKSLSPKLTLGISPTLLSLLDDSDLKERFPPWIKARLLLLKEESKNQKRPANFLCKFIEVQFRFWESIDGDMIRRFASLQNKNVLDFTYQSLKY